MTARGGAGLIARAVIVARWPIVCGFLALVAAAASVLPDLQLDLGISRVLEPSRAELEHVQEFYDDTPPRSVDVVLVVTFEEMIERPQLERLEAIAAGLDAHPRIRTVTSLASIRVMDGPSLLALPRRFPETIGDRTVYDAAWSHPLLRRTLISEDGRSTVIRVVEDRAEPGRGDRSDFVTVLEDVATDLAGDDATVRLLGTAVINRALRGHMTEDITWTLGLEVILFSLLLPILFRTARGSLLPILVVVGAVVLNFGWMAWLGHPIAIIDIAIPGLVVIIGLCDAIHMVHRFEEEYSAGTERRTAITTMLSKVGHACFHTSFTTGVGFLSLVLTDHATVSSFGQKAAASVGVTFLVVVLVIPAALSVWPIRKPVAARQVRVDWLRPVFPRGVVTATIVILLLTGVGIAQVEVDSFLLEEFPDDDPVSNDVRWFEQEFCGIIHMEARISNDLHTAEAFAGLERFQDALLEEEGATRIESYTLWVREALGNPEGPLTDRQIKAAIARLKLVPGVFPEHLLNENLQQGRIVLLTRDVGAQRMLELRERMRDLADDLPGEITLEPAGYTLMATDSARLVVESITRSLGASLVVITLFISLIFRSWRIGLVSLVPNVLPLLIALGLSGWAGLHLRIGSTLIYCLGLGLAVDDSIHLITRYLQEKRGRPDRPDDEHMESALRSSGKALITTSLILGVGTLCHLVGSFQSIRHVGILLFTVIVSALAADLWLLPHLLRRARVR